MSRLVKIADDLEARRAFDVSPPAPVDTGSVLSVVAGEVRHVPQNGAADGDVLTVDSSAPGNLVWAPQTGGGGGGGAPTNATYVTLSLNGTLTNERVLQTTGTGLGLTDNGANSTVDLFLDSDLQALAGVAATGLLVRTGAGTAAAREITEGDGITVADGDGVAGDPVVSVDRSTFAVDARFGDGSDGTVTISVNTVLTRSMNYENLTINAGIIVVNSGCIVSVRDTLTMGAGAEIRSAGNGGGSPIGSVINGGTNSAGSAAGLVGPLGAGFNGATGAGAGGGNGSNSTNATNTWSQRDANNDGTTGRGGAGGGNGVQTGGTVGTVAGPAPSAGWTTDTLHRGLVVAAAIILLRGGGAGSGGASGGGFGGGSGAGGGIVVVNARHVSASGGTLRSDGGNGGPPAVGSTNGCGGGGGGGGKVFLLYETAPGGLPTLSAAGGAAGGGQTGAGTAGAAGAAGTTEATCVLP